MKKQSNRLRLYISWKFPLFYDYIRAFKFPLQLLTVGLVMAVAVGLYNSRYSYDSYLKDFNSAKTRDSSLVAKVDTTTQNPPPVTSQSIQTSTPTSNAVTKTTLLQSEDNLQQQVLKAEALLRDKKQQAIRLEEQVESAKNLLRTSNQNTTDSTAPLSLYTADWMLQQPENHYVVQVAAATEQQFLIQYAREKQFNPPVAIYPFKVNKEGELLYGMSTGLFIVKDDAITELPILSKVSEPHGVWVRKVADIKAELSTLQRDRVLQ